MIEPDINTVFMGWMLVAILAAAAARSVLNVAEGVLGEMSAERAAALTGGAETRGLGRVIREGKWGPTLTAGRSLLHSAEIGAAALLGVEVRVGGGAVVAVIIQTFLAAVAENAARRAGARHADGLAGKVGIGVDLATRMFPAWKVVGSWRHARGGLGDVEVEELRNVVDAARVDDVIDGEEHRIITSAMVLGDLMVKEVMVPWVEVIDIDEDASVGEAIEELLRHHLSRAPLATSGEVYVVNLKDLVVRERRGEGAEMAISGAKTCPVVPGTKPVVKMMREMQTDRQHLAAVADEYGELCGIVSLEDCLEELVGEIEDEHDKGELVVARGNGGTWVAGGSVPIRELRKYLGEGFLAGVDGTGGGHVFDRLGRPASAGDSVIVRGYELRVLEVHRRRIVKLEILRVEETSAQTGGEDR